ncbi:MAG: glycoside hydrolase family 43 protein [Ferruginibacter sp.]
MSISIRKTDLQYFSTFILIFTLLINTGSTAQKLNSSDSSIYLADPAMIQYNGIFYLYGTVGGNGNNGFIAYSSNDLMHWKQASNTESHYALEKGKAFGSAGFWAPQVFPFGNEFYMAYVANENIAIAKSNQPAGPFTQKLLQPLAAPVKQIDPFIFVDDDGKIYLYHVRLTNGNKIFVAEMEADFSEIKPSTLTECITATAPWENTANSKWPVTEGPSVLKHKGMYYLFYTANDFRNPDYAVGYATSKSPYGPWKKYTGNPIISKSLIGINGTGHGDFIKLANGNLKYVFHTHFSDTIVSPRRTAIIDVKFTKGGKNNIDKLVIDKKSFRFLQKAVTEKSAANN